jgi:hypothetical protein
MLMDCCGAQLAFMSRCALKNLGHLEPYHDFVPLPDVVHVCKSERNSTSNYLILCKGWFVGNRIVLVRYYDADLVVRRAVRKEISLFDLRHKNKYSIESAVAMVSHALQLALLTEAERESATARVIFTISPEHFTFWFQNSAKDKDMCKKLGGMDFHRKSGLLFVINNNTLRMLKATHVPATNHLILQSDAFGSLYDIVIIGDAAYLTDYEKDTIWYVDLSSVVKKQAGVTADAEEDGGIELHDGRAGGRKRSVHLRALAVNLTEVDADGVVQKTSLSRPTAICAHLASGEYDFSLFVASERGRNGGAICSLRIERGTPDTAELHLLTDNLPVRPRGIAAARGDDVVICTTGQHVYEWVVSTKTGSVIYESIGAQPCGIYLVPKEAMIGEGLVEAYFVLDEVDNTLIQLCYRADKEWSCITVAGGNEEKGSGYFECGTASLVSLLHPSLGCFAFNSFFFSDTGNHGIRLLTDAYTYAEVVMPNQRLLPEAFSLCKPQECGPGGNAQGVVGCIARLHLHDMYMAEAAADIQSATGINPAAQQGPQGNYSSSQRKAVCLLCSGMAELCAMLEREGCPASMLKRITPLAFNTLPVEKWFGVVREQWPNPSALQFTTLRGSVILESSKRSLRAGLSFDYFTGGRAGRGHYSLPKYDSADIGATCSVFVRDKRRALPQSEEAVKRRRETVQFLHDFCRRVGQYVKQLRVTDFAKERQGQLPYFAWWSLPDEEEEMEDDEGSEDEMCFTGSLSAAMAGKGRTSKRKKTSGKAKAKEMVEVVVVKPLDLVAIKASYNVDGAVYYIAQVMQRVTKQSTAKKNVVYKPDKPAVRWFSHRVINGEGNDDDEDSGGEDSGGDVIFTYDYDGTVNVAAIHGHLPAYYNAVYRTCAATCKDKKRAGGAAIYDGTSARHPSLYSFCIRSQQHEELEQLVNSLEEAEATTQARLSCLGIDDRESDDDDLGEADDDSDMEQTLFDVKVKDKAVGTHTLRSGRRVVQIDYRVLSDASLQARQAASLTKKAKVKTLCAVCSTDDASLGTVVLCDGGDCGKEYHMSCLTPALVSVPKVWLCPDCVAKEPGSK